MIDHTRRFALCVLGLAACVPPAKELAGPDGPRDFGTGIVRLRLGAAPEGDLQIPTELTQQAQIDTNSSICTTDSVEYCVVARRTIKVTGRVRVIGTRPLVLIASESISIAPLGFVDVGSHSKVPAEDGAGADPAGCNPSNPSNTVPDVANRTGGGGAGGTFMTKGGPGGDGSHFSSGSPGGSHGEPAENDPRPPFLLRGGCAGQGNGVGSPGGHGGGAVFLIAQEIDLSGTISAGGGGGGGGVPIMMGDGPSASGGGGGGAGGMIGFDGQITNRSGMPPVIHADGGGGGEGSSFEQSGNDGSDALASNQGPGGTGGNNTGGDGGAGSSVIGISTPGNSGVSVLPPPSAEAGGGGGGGGGAGVIIVPRNVTLIGDISPAPTPSPV